MMLRIAIEFAVTATLISLCMWWAYRRGYRQGHTERLEALAKNARHKANQTQAEANVLEGALPPRVRTARVKGTSRRGLND